MLVFRSLTIGLLGACLYLLGGIRMAPPEVVLAKLDIPTPTSIALAQRANHEIADHQNQVTVIDVAPSVPATTIASLVRLHPGERIVVVDDVHVGTDLEAGVRIADAYRRGSKLLDLTVSGEGVGVRRVLVVQH